MKSVKSITLNICEQSAPTSKRNSPPQDPLSRLPQEIQGSIFSHLSLRERISCTAVSKYWRVSILNSQKTWHRLTDEPHGFYELCQVISKYQQYIQETDVREVVLTGRSNSLQIDQIPMINLNMSRLMHFLASLQCRSIEKAILLTQCYSKAWLNKFKAVAGNSLRHLVLECSLPHQNGVIQVLTTTILNHFPNLQYLSLSVSGHSGWAENNTPVSDQQFNKIEPHNSLCIMILWIESSLSNATPFPSLPDVIVPRLPKLRHISFNTQAFSSANFLKHLYQSLFTYCKELESLDSGWYPVYTSPWEKMPHSLRQNPFDQIPRAEGLKRFQIIPNSSTDHALLQLKAIVPECYTSLEDITIHDIDTIQLNYLTTFRFPRLKKIMCSTEILSEQRHLVSASLVPLLLDNGRQLEHVELKYLEINDILWDVLSTSTSLQTLKLTYCHAVTQKMLDIFRERNNAKLVIENGVQ